jgi:hypothetical protein
MEDLPRRNERRPSSALSELRGEQIEAAKHATEVLKQEIIKDIRHTKLDLVDWYGEAVNLPFIRIDR